MNNITTYNRIKGAKSSFSDYVKSLGTDELLTVYNNSKIYGITIPDLMRNIQAELQRRRTHAQPALF